MRPPLSALATALLFGSAAAQKPPAAHKPAAPAEHATQLPVTRVALYKNGVGFFEHSGRVSGNQAVTIDFTTAQLNDVLQSLTAIDLDGGRITGAGYNSTTPLEQQLQALSLGLPAKTTFSGLFTALRGTRVEVRGSGAPFTGRIVDIEMHKTGPGKEQAGMLEGRFLTIAADSGEIRIFQLTPALTVRLLDAGTHADLTQYLKVLDSNRAQGFRHLTLQDNGTGSRALHVSYISEVPIWKSTYRILFTDPKTSASTQTATLQGWSVVDNTTGADWDNVQLSLIAGAPQSFIQPLSVPYYSRRTQVPLPQEAQLTPQTHESGEGNKDKTAGVAGMSAHGLASPKMMARSNTGRGVSAGSAGGVMGGMGANATISVDAVAPMIEYEEAASQSIAPQTTTKAFDDFFEYKLSDPITIRRNESALVPILQAKVQAERVTLWSQRESTPLRALWMTNTSNLTLDRGSFSIVENGNFGGEGLLDPIHPGERRLLSYAADQAVRVTTDHNRNSRHIERLTISKGVLRQRSLDVSEVEYLIHNAAPDARSIVIEHPVRPGWTIDSDPKPVETTAAVHRFRIEAAPGQTVRLHIGERHPVSERIRLVERTEEQIVLLLRNANASPAVLAQLQPVFDAHHAVLALDKQIADRDKEIKGISTDQDRLRENLKSLKGTAEERALTRRYTEELNGQEDRLSVLRKELESLHAQRTAADLDFQNKLDAVAVDETLSK